MSTVMVEGLALASCSWLLGLRYGLLAILRTQTQMFMYTEHATVRLRYV